MGIDPVFAVCHQGRVARQRPSRLTAKVGTQMSASLVQLSPGLRTDVPDWVTTSDGATHFFLLLKDSDSFSCKCHGRQLAPQKQVAANLGGRVALGRCRAIQPKIAHCGGDPRALPPLPCAITN